MIKNMYFKKLNSLILKDNINAIFITPSEILRYLTGINVLYGDKFQGLFVNEKGNMFYIVPEPSELEVKEVVGKEIEIFTYKYSYLDAIKDAFLKYNMRDIKLAVNRECRAIDLIDIANNYNIKICDGNNLLEELTIIKTEEDIERLIISSEKTDKVFEMILNYIKPGMTESDVNLKMIEFFRQIGIPDYKGGLVSFGSNTALPHYIGDEAILKDIDIVILDYGCKYKGFHSDMTRTFFMGRISDEQRKIYNIVLKANLEAEEKCSVGMTGQEIDSIARNVIENEGYGKNFSHRLGHGIGCRGHEAPYMSYDEKRKLQNGMAFSIEPGIYFPGEFGIRIEDIVIIRNNKAEPINKVSKDIIVL